MKSPRLLTYFALVATTCGVMHGKTLSGNKLPAADGRLIEKHEIKPGIYQFTTLRDGYVRQLNSIVIVNNDDVLVFDTNTRPSTARLIIEQIRSITSKPVRFVVNSHWHPDHWSGNEAYTEAFSNVEIIASRETATYMRNTANSWPARFKSTLGQLQANLQKEVGSGKKEDGSALTPEERQREEDDVRNYRTLTDEQVRLKHIYPTLTYTDSFTLTHGGREFHFMSVTGDAGGTTVLFLPKERVLITGDVVSYPIPYITPPPSMQAATLRRLAELPVDVIIPGHGPAFHDRSFLNLELQLLESVVASVKEQLERGVYDLGTIQIAANTEALREQFTHNDPDLDAKFRDRVKYLVKIAIRELVDNKDY